MKPAVPVLRTGAQGRPGWIDNRRWLLSPEPRFNHGGGNVSRGDEKSALGEIGNRSPQKAHV